MFCCLFVRLSVCALIQSPPLNFNPRQAFTIFFESKCGVVVWEREVFKLHRSGDYSLVPMSEALRRCANRTSSPFMLEKAEAAMAVDLEGAQDDGSALTGA